MKNTATTVGISEYAPYPVGKGEQGKIMEQILSHLSIHFISALSYRCTPDWKLGPRAVPNSYWSFITKGHATLRLGNEETLIEPGNLIIFPSGTEHSIVPFKGEAMAMVNVHFNARIYNIIDFPGLVNLYGVFDDKNRFFKKISLEAARLFALKPPGWLAYTESLIRVQLFEMINRQFPGSRELPRGIRRLSQIYPALEKVEQQFSDPSLTPAILAQKLNISKVYLRKLFNEILGISPIGFIHRHRIEFACTQLMETDMSVKEIAHTSGFNDLCFFYRIFSRLTGTTPAKYRKAPGF